MTGCEAVESWLEATGTTMTALAEKAGVSHQAISWILQRKRPFGPKTALGIHEATGIPLKTLLQ